MGGIVGTIHSWLPVSMGGAPPKPGPKHQCLVNTATGFFVIGNGYVILNTFTLGHNWTALIAASMYIPLGTAYVMWRANKSIEQLNGEFSTLVEDINKLVPKITESLGEAREAFETGRNGFGSLDSRIEDLAVILNTFRERQVESPETHQALNAALTSALDEQSRLKEEKKELKKEKKAVETGDIEMALGDIK